MKTLLLSSAAIALVAGAVPAGAQAPAKTARPMADKTLTRTELTQTIQRQFARIDANKDGFVVKAEADAADKAVRLVESTEHEVVRRVLACKIAPVTGCQ